MKAKHALTFAIMVGAAIQTVGCDGFRESPPTTLTPTVATSVPSPPESEKSAEKVGWWEAPLLTESVYTEKIVVEEQKGRGDFALPALTANGKDPLRIVVSCSGDGDVTLTGDSKDDKPRIKCDEIRAFIDVYTESGEQQFTLVAGPDTPWKVAVIRK